MVEFGDWVQFQGVLVLNTLHRIKIFGFLFCFSIEETRDMDGAGLNIDLKAWKGR